MRDQTGINLKRIIEQTTKLTGSGNKYRGACPLHGGSNPTAFSLMQHRDGAWTFRCFNCGKRGDAIAFVMERDGITFAEARRYLGLDTGEPWSFDAESPVSLPSRAEPPSDDWQREGLAFVERCAHALWYGDYQKPLAYLRKRGFADETIKAARLGYNAGAGKGGDRLYVAREAWGLPNERYHDESGNERLKTAIWLPRGIVIPWFAEGALWAVLIRRPVGNPKYSYVPGKGNAPYNVDKIERGKPLMLVESALDALAVEQAAGDLITAVATGTTGARNMRWFQRFAGERSKLLSFDSDEAGEKAAEYWNALFPNTVRWRPVKDDAASMLESGLPIRTWVEQGLASATEAKREALRMQEIAMITDLHQQIADLGYATDDTAWMDEADLEEVRAYRQVQQKFLVWCQEHKAAVEHLQSAWRSERDAGSDNPADELAMNTDDMSPEDSKALASSVEQRTALLNQPRAA